MCFVLIAAAACIALAADLSMAQGQRKILYSQDFEGLELGPVVQEVEPAGGDYDPDAVWTNVPPEGWTRRVADDMPGLDDEFVGVEEFEGWTFVDADWWTQTAGDQQRSFFSLAEGSTVAVADPDEWDDIGSPKDLGNFNAWLATPPINITGAEANSVRLDFVSSWRDEAFDDGDLTNNQTATITVAFDGGAATEVLRWESDPSDPDFYDDATDDVVSLPLSNPASATSMVIEFGLIDSKNDWWWAVDNIEVTAVGGVGGIIGETKLQPGDADQDLDFDQLDLVRVQIAAKYLTGQAATWGDGDWNGAPGGQKGMPPAGNGRFDQLDIIAALNAGKYLTGPYAALANANGVRGDGQTSIIYNAGTGEVAVDAPAGTNLTSVNIDSAARIFTGAPAQNLGGSFDNDSDGNIFKATFGSSFGSLSFGNVAQAGLSQQFVLGDLTAVGSLAGGGALGNVDLIYIPEPAACVLGIVGVASLLAACRLKKSG
jgi:hypothetical protein